MIGMRTFSKRFKTLCQNNSGIAAVEVGITMLPFLLVVFGTAEFGWYFLHTHTMNTAVSEGVRVGATGAVLDDPDNPGTPLSREDSIKKAIQDRVDGVMVIDPANIHIFEVVEGDWSDPADPAVAADGGSGAFMRVRVTYNHEFFTDFVGGFFEGGNGFRPIISEATFRNENFIL